jgi:hypothetical protein
MATLALPTSVPIVQCRSPPEVLCRFGQHFGVIMRNCCSVNLKSDESLNTVSIITMPVCRVVQLFVAALAPGIINVRSIYDG